MIAKFNMDKSINDRLKYKYEFEPCKIQNFLNPMATLNVRLAIRCKCNSVMLPEILWVLVCPFFPYPPKQKNAHRDWTMHRRRDKTTREEETQEN